MADLLQFAIPKDPRTAKLVYAFIKRFKAQDDLNTAHNATIAALRDYYDLEIKALKSEIHALKYRDSE